jgi:AcrR family transcriptional regulator
VNAVNIWGYSEWVPRSTYHHGDLRRAAIAAAVERVRSGGPNALGVRAVARELEVSPAAIYRHFPDREALVREVARSARGELAGRMLDEVDRVDAADPRTRSIDRFLAVGRAYLAFAAEDPNLLAAAFLPIDLPDAHDERPNPWHILAGTLDELVATGAMPVDRRPGAETIAWSAVHGFALLREARSFSVSAAPEPNAEVLLDAIARSLGVSRSND